MVVWWGTEFDQAINQFINFELLILSRSLLISFLVSSVVFLFTFLYVVGSLR